LYCDASLFKVSLEIKNGAAVLLSLSRWPVGSGSTKKGLLSTFESRPYF